MEKRFQDEIDSKKKKFEAVRDANAQIMKVK